MDEEETSLAPVFGRIDEASEEPDLNKREALLLEVISELRSAPEAKPSVARLYCLGYAWYFHPGRRTSAEIVQNVEQALNAVIELDVGHWGAWLYLGHNAYDIGDYQSAAARFARIQREELSDYMRLRVDEMRLCCRIQLAGLGAEIEAVEQFVQVAEQLPPEDIWPQEFAGVLKRWIPTVSEEQFPRLQAALERLDRAGAFGDWFIRILGSGPGSGAGPISGSGSGSANGSGSASGSARGPSSGRRRSPLIPP